MKLKELFTMIKSRIKRDAEMSSYLLLPYIVGPMVLLYATFVAYTMFDSIIATIVWVLVVSVLGISLAIFTIRQVDKGALRKYGKKFK